MRPCLTPAAFFRLILALYFRGGGGLSAALVIYRPGLPLQNLAGHFCWGFGKINTCLVFLSLMRCSSMPAVRCVPLHNILA